MRNTLRAVRKSILPAGSAFTLASILLLLFFSFQASSYSQEAPGADDPRLRLMRMFGLGLSLVGFALTLGGVVFSRRYRSFKWVALICAGLCFTIWFVVVAGN